MSANARNTVTAVRGNHRHSVNGEAGGDEPRQACGPGTALAKYHTTIDLKTI